MLYNLIFCRPFPVMSGRYNVVQVRIKGQILTFFGFAPGCRHSLILQIALEHYLVPYRKITVFRRLMNSIPDIPALMGKGNEYDCFAMGLAVVDFRKKTIEFSGLSWEYGFNIVPIDVESILATLPDGWKAKVLI